MANVYTVISVAASILLNKCLVGVFNGTGSGRVVRVYRVLALNNQTVAITTGVLHTFALRKLSTGSGGIALTPLALDTQSPSLPAQIVCASNLNYTLDATNSLYRRITRSDDEPLSTATASMDEHQTVPSLNTVWDTNPQQTTVEPIVLREGQGVGLINTVAPNSAGTPIGDFVIEMTVETS